MKSSKGEEELEEAQFGISILGGVFSDSYTFDLPEDVGERQMIIIDKRRQTSKNILENLVRLINLLY